MLRAWASGGRGFVSIRDDGGDVGNKIGHAAAPRMLLPAGTPSGLQVFLKKAISLRPSPAGARRIFYVAATTGIDHRAMGAGGRIDTAVPRSVKLSRPLRLGTRRAGPALLPKP